MMNFDLIIFDCDGTLVDTEYLNNLALAEILAEEGLPQFDIAYVTAHFPGLKLSTCLEHIRKITGYEFPLDMSLRYTTRAADLLPTHFRMIDGAEDLVRTAKDRLKICVGSNGQRENVLASLSLASLKPYFPDEDIFTSVQVAHPKPAPDLFLWAAAKMGAAPQRTLVIEDTVAGTTAGASAGMTVWGFTGLHKDEAHQASLLKEAGAAETRHSLIDIRQALFG